MNKKCALSPFLQQITIGQLVTCFTKLKNKLIDFLKNRESSYELTYCFPNLYSFAFIFEIVYGGDSIDGQ